MTDKLLCTGWMLLHDAVGGGDGRVAQPLAGPHGCALSVKHVRIGGGAGQSPHEPFQLGLDSAQLALVSLVPAPAGQSETVLHLAAPATEEPPQPV